MNKIFDSVHEKALIFFGGRDSNNSLSFSYLEVVMEELRRDVPKAPEDDYYISFLGRGRFVASVSCRNIPNGYKEDNTCYEKVREAFLTYP